MRTGGGCVAQGAAEGLPVAPKSDSGAHGPPPRRILIQIELSRLSPAADLAWAWGPAGPGETPSLLLPPGTVLEFGPGVRVHGGRFVLDAAVAAPAKSRAFHALASKAKRRCLGLGWGLAVRADELALAVRAPAARARRRPGDAYLRTKPLPLRPKPNKGGGGGGR